MKKLDSYKRVSVKILLDNKVTGIFADRKLVKKHSFKQEKLDRPIRIKNVNGVANSKRLVTHEIEYNVYFKKHVDRMKMNVCELGKMEVILGMLWLATHNPEINWETEEIKIMKYLLLYGKKVKIKKVSKGRKARAKDKKNLR